MHQQYAYSLKTILKLKKIFHLSEYIYTLKQVVKVFHYFNLCCVTTLLEKVENPALNYSQYYLLAPPTFKVNNKTERSCKLYFSMGNYYNNCAESGLVCRMCLDTKQELPLLCCGLTWERWNIWRKSFFSSSSGVLFICSAEYGVLRGVVGVEGEEACLLPRTAGGERLRSLIILLLFLLFCSRSSLRWSTVVKPHTCRKSTFCGERNSGRWI